MNMKVAISFQVTILFPLANPHLWSPDLYTFLRRQLVHSSVYHQHWAGGVSLVAQAVKNLSAMQETWDQSLVWEDALEKETATHLSILA